MKQCIKFSFILFVITAICVGTLGAVNQITEPVIAANNKKAEDAAMKSLLPESESFKEIANITDPLVQKIYIAKKGEDTIGYIAKVCPVGYVGEIVMLVGVNKEVQIQGISLLSQSESPGFGANATKDSFKNQFIHKEAPLEVSKTEATATTIQAITGATITSRAVTDGVNSACKYIGEYKAEWEAIK